MKRRALIIYCDDTSSGKLHGPVADNLNIRQHLLSRLGGEWDDNEIRSLRNPTRANVLACVKTHLSNSDYTFVVFTGHGYIHEDDKQQYIELSDGDIPRRLLNSGSLRQTMIIDACRGYYKPSVRFFASSLEGLSESSFARYSTRKLFDQLVMSCECGLTILYAASENQSALDSDKGAAYLYSLLKVCNIWLKTDNKSSKLSVRSAHILASNYMTQNFDTIQTPIITTEKRKKYFPLAVKFIPLQG